MLELPGNLTAETFLARCWQKQPLFMPGALPQPAPAITRNELAWLATLDDVESRIVFTERKRDRRRYRVETGPFDASYLAGMPPRDWTLLVHDVEKHLPALRRFFSFVPFIPDWRIDDLMVSFAAPGGGVGPHKDNYDVFLCQGIGVRDWCVTVDPVQPDETASDDLALLAAFDGDHYQARAGDVLYLPPGVPHWGTAQRACITYSIGMRAPQLADLADALPDDERNNAFYSDADLAVGEARPGWISARAIARARELLCAAGADCKDEAQALGCVVTTTKDWLTPERIPEAEAAAIVERLAPGGRLRVHGMARIACDARYAYANGRSFPLPDGGAELMAGLCVSRRFAVPRTNAGKTGKLVSWLVESGVFEIPGNL